MHNAATADEIDAFGMKQSRGQKVEIFSELVSGLPTIDAREVDEPNGKNGKRLGGVQSRIIPYLTSP